jgi:hypothetical protein
MMSVTVVPQQRLERAEPDHVVDEFLDQGRLLA